MNRVDKARQVNARIKRQRMAIGESVPAVLKQAVISANGDAAAGRLLASSMAAAADLIPARPWAVNIETQPGDIVLDPAGKFAYVYTGKAAMVHTNYTFFPGAAGVYYWSIIPEMHEGDKVFPDIPGLVVFVASGSTWWDPLMKKLYRWTGADYDCPSNFFPGAAGVHQWEEVQ